MEASLVGKVALVAGATRGAGRGIAVQLGAAGATVYATGRATRSEVVLEACRVTESNRLKATKRSPYFAISESPAFVGRAVAALAQDPTSRAGTEVAVQRAAGEGLRPHRSPAASSMPGRYVTECKTRSNPPT